MLNQKQGLILSTASRVVGAATQGMLVVVLARALGAEDFGYYAAAISMSAVVIGLLGMGLPSYILHVRSNEKITATIVDVASVCLATLCVAATSLMGHVLYPSAAIALLLAGGLYTALEYRGAVVQARQYAQGKLVAAEITFAGRRCLVLILALALNNGTEIGPRLSVIVALGATMLSLLPCIKVRNLRKVPLRALASRTRNFWAVGLWSMLQQLDAPILARLLSPSVSGAYAAAFRLASPIHIGTALITTRLVPAINSESDKAAQRNIAVKYVRYAFWYAGLTFCLTPIAYFAGPLILGESYAEKRIFLVIPFLSAGISVICQTYSSILFSKNHGRFVQMATRNSVLSGLLAVSAFGYLQMTVISCLGTAMGQLILLLLLRQQFKSSATWK